MNICKRLWRWKAFFLPFFLSLFFFFLYAKHAGGYEGGFSYIFVLHAALKWFAMSPVYCQIFRGNFTSSTLWVYHLPFVMLMPLSWVYTTKGAGWCRRKPGSSAKLHTTSNHHCGPNCNTTLFVTLMPIRVSPWLHKTWPCNLGSEAHWTRSAWITLVENFNPHWWSF